MKFASFLTKKNMKEWSLDNHKFKTFWIEFRGTEKGITNVMNSEFQKQDSLRESIKCSLGDDYKTQQKAAERWALILKHKSTILDAWSVMFTAIVTLYTIAITGFTVISLYFEKERPIIILLGLLSINIVIIMWKFGVDKRSSWYKQLLCYLDSIAKFEKL